MNKDLKKRINKIKNQKAKKMKKNSIKKWKIINICFCSVFSLVVVAGVSYVIYYFAGNNQTTNSNNNSNNVPNSPSNGESNGNNPSQGELPSSTPKSASQYISERTLALQFVFENSNGQLQVSAGTGWIINKDSNSDSYYIATNLHVASYLTYEGSNKFIYSYENPPYIFYGTIVQCLVGYVNSDVGTNSSASYSDTNMITVPKPTLAYESFNDFTNYPQVIGNAPGDGTSNYNKIAYYNATADFAILKYNFSSASLGTVGTYTNSSNSVSNFENWLTIGYDTDPTKFLNQPIQNVSNWQNLKYSAGGFPGESQSNNVLSASTNYLHQNWQSFSDVGIENSTINYGNAGAVYSYMYGYNDPIVYASGNGTYNSGANGYAYSSGYINVAYDAILDQYLQPGSSGSMLITYINNTPYVVGIYWGLVSFDNNATYGCADFFYTSSNGSYGNTTYPGYNLINSSYTYLSSSNQLYFNPTKNQIN